jgi:hypothetical protein
MSGQAGGDGFPKPCGAMDGGAERTWMYSQRVSESHRHQLACSMSGSQKLTRDLTRKAAHYKHNDAENQAPLKRKLEGRMTAGF